MEALVTLGAGDMRRVLNILQVTTCSFCCINLDVFELRFSYQRTLLIMDIDIMPSQVLDSQMSPLSDLCLTLVNHELSSNVHGLAYSMATCHHAPNLGCKAMLGLLCLWSLCCTVRLSWEFGLQSTHMASGSITEESVYQCTGNPMPQDIETVANWLFNEDFATCLERESGLTFS